MKPKQTKPTDGAAKSSDPASDIFFWQQLSKAGRQNFLEVAAVLESYRIWEALPISKRERILTLAVALSRADWSGFERLLRAKFWKRQRFLQKVAEDVEAWRKMQENA
jgi:hypothetical protein